MANGKGSSPRPLSVTREEFDRRWRETFGEMAPTVHLPGGISFVVYATESSESWARFMEEIKKTNARVTAAMREAVDNPPHGEAQQDDAPDRSTARVGAPIRAKPEHG